MSFGFSRSAVARSSSKSIDLGVLPHAVRDDAVELPRDVSGWPWVRWPPCASDMPMNVSPGFRHAMYTAVFACAPACGWTFTWIASGLPGEKSAFARAIASDSASSTNSQPP